MHITLGAPREDARISPLLYGIFLEDINYGCDGGLYAELIANRAFENVGPEGVQHRLMRWQAVGGASLCIQTQDARGEKNPHYLRTTPGEGRGAAWGVQNEGYLGQGLYAQAGKSYRLRVIARAQGACTLTARLLGETGRVLASARISLDTRWREHTAILYPDMPGGRAYLSLTVTPGTPYFDLDFVSLFPVHTFMGRENGARADLAQALADLKPAFLRFPGGCIVEGRSFKNMYRWKETLGPVEERRTNWNRWQLDEYQIEGRSSEDYYQTYGMGFYEFLLFCQDIGCKPLPILNCGLTCQWHEGLCVPLDRLEDIIADYLDLIEFCNGDTSTRWGAERARLGHPAPFGLEMIGVGNEQWDAVYFERYERIHKAVKARYPHIKLVGCAGWTDHGREIDAARGWMRRTECKPDYSDEHYYKRTDWFFENIDRYADYDEALPRVFAGEYAAHSARETALRRNSLHTALAEAAYMTGLENASPRVAMSCYAPLLARIGANQWQPDLIFFDEKGLVRTPNYHVQQLFAQNRGDTLAHMQCTGDETLHMTAAYQDADGALILKAVNPGTQPIHTCIALPDSFANAALHAQVLCGEDLDAENTQEAPDRLIPVAQCGAAQGTTLDFTFVPQSVSILRIG